MPETKIAAPTLQRRDGQKMRGTRPPRATIVHHRPAEYKTRLDGTAAAALAVLACLCLAEWLGGSGWGYIVLAIVVTLAANAFAGAALSGRKEARHD